MASDMASDMAGDMAEEPADDAWPCAPVPSVPGDVWHWQLEAMHVVSRVRSDLRARIAHPSVSSASTEDARDGLLLVFEELASNALRHGGGRVRAAIRLTTEAYLIEVSDQAAAAPPAPAVDRDPSEGGLGLYLIAEMSTAHGWYVSNGHKYVWALLPRG
jgi:anti-sigma regulatory factor (Ser/Thr protein kinase)